MAYTSVLPVHRLDRSIDSVKDRAKTTKSAGSLEEAIDYALNREKTEQTIFEDAMGCTCENAYVDMVKIKERFHKKDGVQGYHLVQSFAEGEVSPELAHLIGQELAEQLLKGQYEVVITTHLNTSHYHNHLVWNSVSMVDGKKYHSNAKSYFTEVRQISDQLCRKYGLSVIQTNQGKAMHYAQWKAEAEGKPTWRTAIRMDIQEAIAYDIRELGEQLMPLGMLVTLDSIFNRVIQNWKKGKTTWIFADEFYLLFRYQYSADFFYRLYKRIRKYQGFVTGLTQNVEELLKSDTARLMLANSEFLILLNQATTDRDELASLLNISENQLSYITNVGAGKGLIRCSGNLVPFENSFPKNTKLYRLMTTKPGEC